MCGFVLYMSVVLCFLHCLLHLMGGGRWRVGGTSPLAAVVPAA